MSLPQEHLEYPRRRHGQDIDRYDWRLAKDRAPVRRADGADLSVMIVVACEFHPIEPKKDPFNHPHGMVTPYPDLRHFTTRDYGNRVGVFRILRAMKAHGVRATFALSADLLARAAPLAEAVVEDGHEIAAAGLNGDAIHHGTLDEDDERRRIEAVRAAFERAGLAPRTWLSPARQQSFNTPDLLVEHGFDICLDWEIDQVPVSMRTRSGPLTCLPLHNELDDYKLLIERTQEEAVWARQIAEAREALLAEADDRGAQVFGFSLTPFVTGQPFRYPALDAVLHGIAADPRCRTETAQEIAAAFPA